MQKKFVKTGHKINQKKVIIKNTAKTDATYKVTTVEPSKAVLFIIENEDITPLMFVHPAKFMRSFL